MAQSLDPIRRFSFGGIITAGDPRRRPPDTSIRCRNLRLLPGGSIRLRGGRTRLIAATPNREYKQFYEFRRSTSGGGIFALAQVLEGGVTKWLSMDLVMATTTVLEQCGILGTQIGDHLAITTVRDKVFWQNGYGAREVTSYPGLSSWDGTTVRYVGLDNYCPFGNPTVAFAAGAGHNIITAPIDIYVGLYNSTTGHFSNGVLAGTISEEGEGAITVSNLSNLKHASHNATEENELKYVFYSTLPGGKVPYMILNADASDVFTVAISAGSASLSIVDTDDDPNFDYGYFLDLTSEMPANNFPPRPMRQLCYANGRVYGALFGGGGGTLSTQGFTYEVHNRELAAVVYSSAADDYQDADFVGVPEESWPLRNKKYTPNGEIPKKIAPSPNRDQVLVITHTGTFLLEETADGLHRWDTTISEVDGILSDKSFVQTPYGPMWVTQNRELVLLRRGAMTLDFLSRDYSELLSPAYIDFVVAADYLRDPENQIDRYQVWANNGTFIIHDFELARDQARRGVTVSPASTGGEFTATAAKTMNDSFGRRYHCAAHRAVFVHEADPGTRQVPTRDQQEDGTYLEINGEYIQQWNHYGDHRIRKEFSRLGLIGDVEDSPALGGRSPITITWWGDFDIVNEFPIYLQKDDQSLTDQAYSGPAGPEQHKFWFKFRIILNGHGADGTTTYPAGESYFAEVVPPIFGLVSEMYETIKIEGRNRPA